MNDNLDLKEMEKNSWLYSMQDGLMEVLLGLFLLIYGILLPRTFAAVFAIFFIIFGMRGLESVRGKFTYPRVGKVKVLEDDSKVTVKGIFTYMAIVIVIMVVAIYMIFGKITADLFYRSTPIIFAIMLLGAMTYTHGKTGSRRFYLYAALALVTAPFFTLLDLEGKFDNLGYFLLFMGATFVGVGLVIFIDFLRKNPLPTEEL